MSITTLGQSGPGSNGNEGVLNIQECSRTGALSNAVLFNIQDTH